MLSKGVLSHEIHWIKGTEIKTLTHNKLWWNVNNLYCLYILNLMGWYFK